LTKHRITHGETMKKRMLLAVFGVGSLLTACGSNSFPEMENVFTHQTNLEPEQRSIVDHIEASFVDAADELLEPEEQNNNRDGRNHQAERRGKGHQKLFHRGFTVDWMILFIEGELDRDGVVDLIVNRQSEMNVHMQEREAKLIDLLISFTPEQASQFIDNLEERQDHIEERQAEMERPVRPQRGSFFSNLNLSLEQQATLDAIILEMQEDRVTIPTERAEQIESFLQGEKTVEELETAFMILREQKQQKHIERIEEWIELLGTLSDDQEDILLQALEEVQERQAERCSNMEEQYGSHAEEER